MVQHARRSRADAATGRPASRARPAGATALPAGMRDLELLADLMDSRFRIPGTRIRFGLDSVLGLVPGAGDLATTLPAAYILLRAHRMGVPRTTLLRMGWNVAMDLGVGAIPVVGDIFDLGFKANRRNIDLLRQHFGSTPQGDLREPVQGSF